MFERMCEQIGVVEVRNISSQDVEAAKNCPSRANCLRGCVNRSG